jgi:arginyl-tRNA--protein-N-Asp/Glu arginylyltransferase
MSDLSDWLTEQNLAGLARFTNRPPQELGQVTVTDEMTGAAMEYVYSLYDPLMSTHLMEEVFRIMAVLQPKDLVTKVELL